MISRSANRFVTSVFRKKTFTGLGLNFFSFCSNIFKTNSCKTLFHRAYNLCSNWHKFHEEVEFLSGYFSQNCYPKFLIDKVLNKFLTNIFQPKPLILTVPKKVLYISLPYSIDADKMKRELIKVLSHLYPYVDFRFVFKNPLTIGSLFSFKDSLPELMRSSVVYKYVCPKCNFGNYVGCTKRLLKVRIDSHRGVSHRTGCTLKTKEHSNIRSHSYSCKHNISYTDFKIIASTTNSHHLPILESLYIKQLVPELNNQTTSIPLHIA